tara:strand:- start:15557 stop:16126 length:570 start_codon:yes stop_codon:yes gene_type:complete
MQLVLNISNGPPGCSLIPSSVASNDVYADASRLIQQDLDLHNKFTIANTSQALKFKASRPQVIELLGTPSYESTSRLILEYGVGDCLWFYTSKASYEEFFDALEETNYAEPVSPNMIRVLTHIVVGCKYTTLHEDDRSFGHNFYVSISERYVSDTPANEMLENFRWFLTTHLPFIKNIEQIGKEQEIDT